MMLVSIISAAIGSLVAIGLIKLYGIVQIAKRYNKYQSIPFKRWSLAKYELDLSNGELEVINQIFTKFKDEGSKKHKLFELFDWRIPAYGLYASADTKGLYASKVRSLVDKGVFKYPQRDDSSVEPESEVIFNKDSYEDYFRNVGRYEVSGVLYGW